MSPLALRTGDMLETPGHSRAHLYTIASIALGGLLQESIVELEPLDQSKPSLGKDTKHPLVPLHMIEAGVSAGIFTHTAREQLDEPHR